MWLLHEAVHAELKAAHERGFIATPEQTAAFTKHVESRAESSRLLSTAGGTAEISVKGVLTESPSFMAFLFGGGNTAFSEMRQALAEADANPEVDEIVLNIDSPGGTVAGLFPTLDAMAATNKPIRAVVANMAASAAFAIAAAADTIEATNEGAHFGSVGTAKTFAVDSEEVTITSTNAPNKVPDVTTEEGAAVVREELDAVHALFVSRIAAGRNTDSDTVNAEFGRGAVLLANEALKRGMIDSVKSAKTSTARTTSGNNSEAKMMDLTTLKAQHPDTYAAAVQQGIEQERDRVSAHLELGTAYNAMDTAVAAVKDGSDMTALLTAKYVAAGANSANIQQRAADDEAADPGETGKGDATEAQAKAGLDDILARASAQLGIEVKGV